MLGLPLVKQPFRMNRYRPDTLFEKQQFTGIQMGAYSLWWVRVQRLF